MDLSAMRQDPLPIHRNHQISTTPPRRVRPLPMADAVSSVEKIQLDAGSGKLSLQDKVGG